MINTNTEHNAIASIASQTTLTNQMRLVRPVESSLIHFGEFSVETTCSEIGKKKQKKQTGQTISCLALFVEIASQASWNISSSAGINSQIGNSLEKRMKLKNNNEI